MPVLMAAARLGLVGLAGQASAERFDFHKIRWGMSKEEVLKSEETVAYLTGSIILNAFDLLIRTSGLATASRINQKEVTMGDQSGFQTAYLISPTT
jgi:hypothetical protein